MLVIQLRYGALTPDAEAVSYTHLDVYKRQPKGYVVMSGCSLPVETPAANIQMMIDTTREVGYPVNPDKVEAMLADCHAQLAAQN